MARFDNTEISREQFLLIALNLLHGALLRPGRTAAKQRFRELQQGRPLALGSVQMEDGSTARFGVALDSSEFRGRLNFGAFRVGLEHLLANLGAHLKEEKAVTVFRGEADADTMIFGVSAVTVEDGRANVMVLGAEPDPAGATLLRLMYLDPEQFARRETA